MDAFRSEDLRGRLLALLIRLGDRLDLACQENAHSLVDAGQYGLALEWMADGLSEAESPISEDEEQLMLELVGEMRMTGRVQRALALCPRRRIDIEDH
jgi:hypothetical protein